MSYHIKGDRLILNMDVVQRQVLPYYPYYRADMPAPGAIVDFHDQKNTTGNQQRAWLVHYCLKAFTESGGIPGIDLGSAGIRMPGCLPTDFIANTESPLYGGSMNGVALRVDATDLRIFGNDSFSCIVANHLIEHLPCNILPADASQEDRYRVRCPGIEILPVLRDHWLRVLYPGGYICIIFPDESYAREDGGSVLYHDETHRHAWDAKSFYWAIIEPLLDKVEVVEFDTLGNRFSTNVALRKKF